MADINQGPNRNTRGDLGGEGPSAHPLCFGNGKRNEHGYTTLLVLVLLVILSLYGMESFIKANAQAKMARREIQSRQALYEAEGGLEWAKAQLRIDPSVISGNISFGSDQVQISILSSGGGYWVTSIAQSGQAERKITVYLQLDDGRWLETHYQELHS